MEIKFNVVLLVKLYFTVGEVIRVDLLIDVECQQEDWKSHKSEVYSLIDPCTQFQKCKEIASSNSREEEYANHPFTYSKESTSYTFNLTHFLKQRNLHKVGFWWTECECCFVPRILLPLNDRTYGLSGNYVPPNTSLESSATITNWQEYYLVRGIDLDSPVAILLSFPMTVYHLIANVLKLNRDPLPSRIVIHYIGVEKEVCHLPIWKELLHLLPGIQNITIMMIGLEFDEDETTHEFESGTRKLSIHLIKSVYHTFDAPEKPTFIVALNAGIFFLF